MVKNNFTVLGICSNQPRLNKKSVVAFLFIGLAANLSAAFFIFNANSFVQYVNTAYVTCVFIASNIIFASLLFNKEKLLGPIHGIVEFVAKSELQTHMNKIAFEKIVYF